MGSGTASHGNRANMEIPDFNYLSMFHVKHFWVSEAWGCVADFSLDRSRKPHLRDFNMLPMFHVKHFAGLGCRGVAID